MPNAKKLNEQALTDGRVGRLRATRMFTDREDLREAYHALTDRAVAEKFENCYVINYYGLGGIGKTTLLGKLRDEVRQRAETDASHRHISLMLDFDSVVADPVPALEHLKAQLQAQDFNFPLFELALYALYEKSGHIMSARERASFFERNPMIEALVDAAGMLPVIGMVATLSKNVIRIAGKARNAYQRALDRRKGSLYEIETMDARALRSNLPLLFTQDVNDQLDDGTMLHLFIDTYEKLVSVAEGEQGAHSAIRNDDWLYGRDGLIRNLGNAVFAIAGREKLHWPESSEFWAEEGRLEAHLTDHLSENDSARFLGSCGVDAELWYALYQLTDGQPVYLDLCVDQYYDVLDAGRTPAPEDFGRNVEMLVERHSRYIPEHQRDALYLMAGMRRWNKQIFDLAASAAGISVNPSEYSDRLTRLSYVTDEGGGIFAMHQVVARVLSSKLHAEVARPASVALAKFVKEQAESAQAQDSAEHAVSAQAQEGAELALEAAANLAGENARTAELAEAFEALAERAVENLQFRQALELRQRALEVCRAAMGEEHLVTLDAMCNLTNSYDFLGKYQCMRELEERVYEVRRRVQGEEHPDTLSAMNNLTSSYIMLGECQRARELGERAYEVHRRVLGEEHPDTLSAIDNLAVSFNVLGEYQRALELEERVYEVRRRVLGEEHPDTLSAMDNLAIIYSSLGKYRRALELAEQAYEVHRRVQGEEHPETLITMCSLAVSYSYLGENQRALELEEQAYEACKRQFGEEHPLALTMLNNLAAYYYNLGKYHRALELFEQVCERSKRVRGEEHPATLLAMIGLASCYSYLGSHQRALELAEQAYKTCMRVLGERHPTTLAALDHLATFYGYLGEHKRAWTLQNQAFLAYTRLLGLEHPITLNALTNLATCFSNLGDNQNALALQSRGYSTARHALGGEHPVTLNALNNLASFYHDVGNDRLAVELQRHAYEAFRRVLGEEHPTTLNALNGLVNCYTALDKPDRALELAEQLYEARKRVLGEDHPDTLAAQSSVESIKKMCE